MAQDQIVSAELGSVSVVLVQVGRASCLLYGWEALFISTDYSFFRPRALMAGDVYQPGV